MKPVLACSTSGVLFLFGLGLVSTLSAQGVSSGQSRDSAGVRIVQHAAVPRSLTTWTLSQRPAQQIGTVEGAGPFLFSRVVSMNLRTDGGVVIADQQSRQLRAFSDGGRHLWTAGRPGNGPGEFNRIIRTVALRGDSTLVVSDGRRLAVFDRNGRYIKDLQLTLRNMNYPDIVGAMSDGTLVGVFRAPGSVVGNSQNRPLVMLAYFGSEGGYKLQVGPFPGDEQLTMRGPETDGISVAGLGSLQMSRRTVVAVGSERVAVGDQARFELKLYDREGRLRTIIRILERPRPLDRRRYDQFHKDRACPPMGCWWDAFLPETLPAFGRVLIDTQGRLWVEEFVAEYETNTPQWWVLSPEGQFIARTTEPRGFTLLRPADTFVWGLWQDDLDVTYLHRRVLERSAR